MEFVAIGTDLWLGGDATMGEPLFWMSLAVSLSCGLLAAYPVNLLLIHYGVKGGLHSPKCHMDDHRRGLQLINIAEKTLPGAVTTQAT